MFVGCCTKCKYLDLVDGKSESNCPRCSGKIVSLKVTSDEWNNLNQAEKDSHIKTITEESLTQPEIETPKEIFPVSIEKPVRSNLMYIYYCPGCNDLVGKPEKTGAFTCSNCGESILSLGIEDSEWNELSNDEMLAVINKSKNKNLIKKPVFSNAQENCDGEGIYTAASSIVLLDEVQKSEASPYPAEDSNLPDINNDDIRRELDTISNYPPSQQADKLEELNTKIPGNPDIVFDLAKVYSVIGYSFIKTNKDAFFSSLSASAKADANKYYTKAIQLINDFFKDNDPSCQPEMSAMLGLLYERRIDLTKDGSDAENVIKFYSFAADKVWKAAFSLGLFYNIDTYGFKNPDKAIEYLKKAAAIIDDKTSKPSQIKLLYKSLGDAYLNNKGDNQSADYWYSKASEINYSSNDNDIDDRSITPKEAEAKRLEEARVSMEAKIAKYNAEKKKQEREEKVVSTPITETIERVKKTRQRYVDGNYLTVDGLRIPIKMIKRVIYEARNSIRIFVIGDNNKLIHDFYVSDGVEFLKILVRNVRINGGTSEAVEQGKRLCRSCYHVIPSDAMNCPHCKNTTGAVYDKNFNGYKCPSCGKNAGHPIKAGRKLVSIGFLGVASNTIGKSYQCHNCNYMW